MENVWRLARVAEEQRRDMRRRAAQAQLVRQARQQRSLWARLQAAWEAFWASDDVAVERALALRVSVK
ncbi:MAG: hypothetical protein GX605_12610 [Chloroflexi bacterium]|nr:hypothetical protein [Chloroflexota bacterium]